jgi:NitT/TauT family transport system substrate-binding protein
MKNTCFAKIVPVILILNILTGCSVLQPVEAPDNEPIRMGYTEWWGDYTLVVGKEKGFFQQQGVQVEPIFHEVYSEYIIDLASGQMDGAFLAMGDVININHVSPMKVVGVTDDGGADSIVVSPDIESIADLQGKKVGVRIGTQYELMVTEMLRSAGMDSSDVTIVEVDPEEVLTALSSDRVQAVYTWEPFLSEAVADGNKVIFPNEKMRLFPDVIVFRRSVVEQRPDDIKAFLRAWFLTVEYRMQHEGETRDIAAKYLELRPEEIQPDNNLKILTLSDNKAIFDIQDKNSIYTVTNITSDYLISIGAVTQQVDLLELIDPNFLP